MAYDKKAKTNPRSKVDTLRLHVFIYWRVLSSKLWSLVTKLELKKFELFLNCIVWWQGLNLQGLKWWLKIEIKCQISNLVIIKKWTWAPKHKTLSFWNLWQENFSSFVTFTIPLIWIKILFGLQKDSKIAFVVVKIATFVLISAKLKSFNVIISDCRFFYSEKENLKLLLHWRQAQLKSQSCMK